MTTEELLKPRYKVIADYPNSIWKVGEILYEKVHGKGGFWDAEVYRREKDITLEEILVAPNLYPHLFKKLQWYEERKESDMPEYIRLNQKWVAKVKKNHEVRFEQFEADNGNYYTYTIGLPATKEEYLNQTK